MAAEKPRRKGWRKQPRRDALMRLAPSYRHVSGASIQQDDCGWWFFVCTTASGETLNSLWRTGGGRMFETATDAMKAAESAMAKEVRDGQ